MSHFVVNYSDKKFQPFEITQ